MLKNILIIIPTYNESSNISFLAKELLSIDLPISVLVVDDNSPDKTADIIKDLQKTYKKLFILERPKKMGLGTAYIYGFKYAIKNGYNIIIQMDADLSHSPKYIPEMLTHIENHDLVIGSRYIDNGGTSNWRHFRKFLSKSANNFAKVLLHMTINDLTSGFKCIKTSSLEKISFETIPCKGYGFQIEMVYRAFTNNCRIMELPIIFKGRKKDKSKMSISIAVETFFRILKLYFFK